MAAAAMMPSSWRTTCMVARFSTVEILMFWVESLVRTGHINFYIKCREEDYDGLGCDDGHGSGVGGCYSFGYCYCPFLFMQYYFL